MGRSHVQESDREFGLPVVTGEAKCLDPLAK